MITLIACSCLLYMGGIVSAHPVCGASRIEYHAYQVVATDSMLWTPNPSKSSKVSRLRF